MLTVHHLNNSRSQRVLWLLEELGVSYQIERYEREQNVPAVDIAAALPATLFLFFVADVLQLERASGPLLALYFVAGAASLPLWVTLSVLVVTCPCALALAMSAALSAAAFFSGQEGS